LTSCHLGKKTNKLEPWQKLSMVYKIVAQLDGTGFGVLHTPVFFMIIDYEILCKDLSLFTHGSRARK